MRYFTKSISVMALGVSLAFVAPGELPSADNNFSILTEAEAGTVKEKGIRRLRHTSRSKGLKAYLGKVVTEENGESTDSVEIRISNLDGQPLVETSVKKADWQRVNFKGVEGLSAEIEVVDYRDGDDNFNMPSMPGETTTAAIGKTKTFLSVTNNGDGSFDVTLEGEPKNVNDFCAVKVVDGGLCGTFDDGELRLGGQPLITDTIEAEWETKLPNSIKEADIEGTKVVISATAYGEDGEVLDSSTSAVDVGDAGGEELDYAEFRIEGDDDDLLLIINQTDATTTEATLDVRISSETLGTDIINETALPATPFRDFTFEPVQFVEPDNVADMEYKLLVSIMDQGANIMAFGTIRMRATETTEFQELTFEEPFEGPVPDELDIFGNLSLNEDGETFTFNFTLLGELAKTSSGIGVIIEPDDGGSEADPSEVQSTESEYLNVWDFPAPDDAYEIMAASDSVSYDLRLYGNGELQDITGNSSAVTESLDGDTPFFSMEDLENFSDNYLSSDDRRRRLRYIEVIRRKAGKAAAK